MKYVQEAVDAHKICGDGAFTKKCHAWIEERFNASKVLLTTSGTSALEMATILCGLKAGDEVILPSYTFSSTATAVVLTSAVPVFVDVRPDTMNIDETKIEAAITGRTKAIIAVHYAGVACEMDTIMDIAARYKLKVIEDAAQGVMSTYKGRALGTIADFGCYSFHETKNYWSLTTDGPWKRLKSYVRRVPTVPAFSAARSTSIHGSITAAVICPAT